MWHLLNLSCVPSLCPLAGLLDLPLPSSTQLPRLWVQGEPSLLQVTSRGCRRLQLLVGFAQLCCIVIPPPVSDEDFSRALFLYGFHFALV